MEDKENNQVFWLFLTEQTWKQGVFEGNLLNLHHWRRSPIKSWWPQVLNNRMFESGEGQQHAKRSDSGELDAGAEVDKTYGFQLPEDEPGQVGTMIYICVGGCWSWCWRVPWSIFVCKCVCWWMMNKVEMRCQATADDYAVKENCLQYIWNGKFLEAPMLLSIGLMVRW